MQDKRAPHALTEAELGKILRNFQAYSQPLAVAEAGRRAVGQEVQARRVPRGGVGLDDYPEPEAGGMAAQSGKISRLGRHT